MTGHRRTPSSNAALRHPVTLGALGLLLVNDLVLKGSGLVPGWLTGKLSDFAWLVVAPVALAALFGVRSRRGHAAIVAGFVALMVATELSQAAADAVAGAANAFGVGARLWADPTDLIALSVLPVTWHLLARPDERLSGGVGSRALLGVAVFASVATTAPPPSMPGTWTTTAFFVNRTSSPISLRIRPTLAGLDCAALETLDLSVATSREIFESGLSFTLAPGATVPIEPAAAMVAATGGIAPPPTGHPCDVVLLSVDGAPDTVVRMGNVRGTVPTILDGSASGTLGADDEVALVLDGSALVFTAGGSLRAATLDERTPPATCDAPLELAYSVAVRGDVTLTTVSRGADGCVQASIVAADGPESTLFVCVPDGFFPYAPGDVLSVRDTADGLHVTGPAGRLHVATGMGETLMLDRITITATTPTCVGDRLACGAFARPRRAVVRDASGELVPTSGVYHPTGATSQRLVLGLVEATVIAPSDCDPAHATVATRMSAALFTE